MMKLNHYIARAGITSRRKAAELIKKGRVKINSKIVKDPSYEVKEKDIVVVGGKPAILEKKIYILLNKPAGYITTVADERVRPTVLHLINKSIKERVYPVGRLDFNTTGLLLMTNDGDLAQALAHPRHRIQKTYHVILDRPIAQSVIDRIKKGVKLSDGFVYVDRISYLPKLQKNHIRIVLHSGKYRVVRRLFRYLGFTVKALDRIAYAGLTKKGLPRGSWRFLTDKEIEALKRYAALMP